MKLLKEFIPEDSNEITSNLEAKNKVGVSDSSISQLVYRLRNKVKGKYKIEAIHGRGFKIPG